MISKWYIDEMEKVAILTEGKEFESVEPYTLRFG